MPGAANAKTYGIALARRFLDRLASQSNRTLRSPGVAEVHDLRVAIRRFTQVLLVFKPCFPAKEIKRVHRALKKTMALAGEARDLDIALGFLAKSRLKEAARLLADFQSRRKEAGRILTDKLQDWAKRRISSKWRRKLLAASANPGAADLATIEDATKETLPRLVKRFFALGNQTAGGARHSEQLHQLRNAAKKLRYTLELLGPPRESALGGRLDQLKKLQAILGSVNDAELVRTMVLREDAARRLSDELARRRDQKIDEFESFWKTEVAGDGSLGRWRKDLTGVSQKRHVPSKPPARSESAMRPAPKSNLSAN